MLIERANALSREEFVDCYLIPNRPVIVTDAMERWAASGKWTPEFFSRTVGDQEVQVYNDLFDLVNITTLSDYFEENFGRPDSDPSTEYVRWYSKLKDLDFQWADEAFDRIKGDWSTPYFLPTTGFLVPQAQGRELAVESSLFPYRGIFVSGRGARTRLHRDPWTSSAVLCQFYGSKSLAMYDPGQAPYLVNDGELFVDIDHPNEELFPDFHKAKPGYQDVLSPGEVLYIPSGWFHHVISLTDSISITWNFVHAAMREKFCEHLKKHPEDPQLEIMRFFLGEGFSCDASVQDIAEAVMAME